MPPPVMQLGVDVHMVLRGQIVVVAIGTHRGIPVCGLRFQQRGHGLDHNMVGFHD